MGGPFGDWLLQAILDTLELGKNTRVTVVDTTGNIICTHHPQTCPSFATADTEYVLTFSLVMLSTDLHNPSIKQERKMTKDNFVRSNYGIDNGQNVPKEVLESLYDSVKERQFVDGKDAEGPR